MKWLGRILYLLFGLLWRLVVLLLFEKWVPFPDQRQAAPVAPPTTRKKKKRAREQAQQAGAPKQAARKKQVPPPFFVDEFGSRASTSSELSPELAAQREGEHWLPKARGVRTSLRAAGKRESLASLLRDRRALRDAVVLGAALGARRSKP